MQINFKAKELDVTITDEHGKTVLDYKVENYLFSADLPRLVKAAQALIAHITEENTNA